MWQHLGLPNKPLNGLRDRLLQAVKPSMCRISCCPVASASTLRAIVIPSLTRGLWKTVVFLFRDSSLHGRALLHTVVTCCLLTTESTFPRALDRASTRTAHRCDSQHTTPGRPIGRLDREHWGVLFLASPPQVALERLRHGRIPTFRPIASATSQTQAAPHAAGTWGGGASRVRKNARRAVHVVGGAEARSAGVCRERPIFHTVRGGRGCSGPLGMRRHAVGLPSACQRSDPATPHRLLSGAMPSKEGSGPASPGHRAPQPSAQDLFHPAACGTLERLRRGLSLTHTHTCVLDDSLCGAACIPRP